MTTEHPVRTLIELSASAIEILAVAVILFAVLFGTARFLLHLRGQVEDAYERYKVHLGKGLLLGLEFLVAADIVRTVVLESTLENVVVLGVLVLVRTFLSWSLVVEIEGRWPWGHGREMDHAARREAASQAAGHPEAGASRA